MQVYAFSPCELYAEIRVSPLYHNGSIRQNLMVLIMLVMHLHTVYTMVITMQMKGPA